MWRREAENIPVDPEDIRIENKGRVKRSDTSKREESLRSKSIKEEDKDRKDIRDASVGAPDTKESGCQTRESLFQVEPAPSSDGKSTLVILTKQKYLLQIHLNQTLIRLMKTFSN